MSLDAQLAAFKHRSQNQPILHRNVVRPQPPTNDYASHFESTPSTSDPSTLQPPKKRQKTTIVYSQPKDTGMGQHLFTQLTYAVDYLKKQPEPISDEKIASYLSTTMTPALKHLLQNDPRVAYHQDTDLYEFRPLHNIRNASSLVAVLATQSTGAGLAVKELKDGYTNIEEDLGTLETQGHVLVIRGKKDGVPRMVWYNDAKLNVTISEEFKEMYHGLKVPEAGDLPRELEKVGMTPASVDPRSIKRVVVEKEKKKKGRRRGKITNTHLMGMLREYNN